MITMGREAIAWSFFIMLYRVLAAALQIVVILFYFHLDKKFSAIALEKLRDVLRQSLAASEQSYA